MRRTMLSVTLLCLWLGLIPAMSQSVKEDAALTVDVQHVEIALEPLLESKKKEKTQAPATNIAAIPNGNKGNGK